MRLLIPGLLDGEHSFRLEPLTERCTRFVQSESFRGVLVGPLSRQIDKTQLGMEHMNGALKLRAEGR